MYFGSSVFHNSVSGADTCRSCISSVPSGSSIRDAAGPSKEGGSRDSGIAGELWSLLVLQETPEQGEELARGILSCSLGRGSPKAVDNRTSSLAGVSWDAGCPLCKCQECL